MTEENIVDLIVDLYTRRDEEDSEVESSHESPQSIYETKVDTVWIHSSSENKN